MGRIFKWLVYLLIIAVIGLIAYAYIGPTLFPADFSPPQTERREAVELDGS